MQAQAKPEPSATATQPFDATNLRDAVEIGTQGLVHAGDDPAYSRPDFDDTKWLPFDAKTRVEELFPHSQSVAIWRRVHIKVSPGQTGLALQAFFVSRAFEVYVNGQKLMQSGQVRPFVPYTEFARVIMPISDAGLRTGYLVIAIRQHYSRADWESPRPSFYADDFTLGLEKSLRDQASMYVIRGKAGYGLVHLLGLGLGLVALVLFTAQRRQPEYLWIVVIVIMSGSQMFLDVLLQIRNIPAGLTVFLPLLNCLSNLAFMLLCQAFLRRRFSWRFWLSTAVSLLLYYAVLAAVELGSLPVTYVQPAEIPYDVIYDLILPWLFFRRLRSGDREAGILLIPLLALGVSDYGRSAMAVLQQIPAARAAAIAEWQRINSLHVGIFKFSLGEDASVTFLGSLGIIMVQRFTRLSREQAVLEGEMAAAREVQQVILPEAVDSVPGFTVESVYQPAQQVGGDFFQILPAGKGGLLAVVGDVAGKGLPAAMLVSVLVGAIRGVAEYTKDPAELLANLNERLVGRGGSLSTALVAHITADGWVTIANAGHLSPYLDGHEIELPGAFPLGVMSGARYETIQFHLAHGSRLTFYSDGVIEAQNQKGELFGFDRAKAISTQSAEEIVTAAKQFGQSDDITVLAIQRAAAIATAA
jgi:hypothetical protein